MAIPRPPATRNGRIRWYAHRLGSMSLGELWWRSIGVGLAMFPRRSGEQRTAAALLTNGTSWEAVLENFRVSRGRPVLLDRARAGVIAERYPTHVAALVQRAEDVFAGRVGYFGYPSVRLGSPVDWNHDLVTGFRWPAIAARRIDHRTAPADPKWIWELNRLQHLPWLAQAWLFTGEDRFAELALDQLDSWIEQNPVDRGIAWRGAFEAGIRSLSVVIAIQGLRDSAALTPDRFERIVRMLAASADRCWRHRSRFSSANNHLVGELAGMAAIAMLIPEMRLAAQWEERATAALRVEASRQILSDGAGAEQAVAYQVFTAELLLVITALLRSRGEAPPPEMMSAIARSAEYLACLVGHADPAPRYGDDDEGFALRLGAEAVRTVRDHLGIVGAFLGEVSLQKAGGMSLTAAWMESVNGEPPTEMASSSLASSAGSFLAPQGGLVVLRSGGRRLTMDVGPLGYLAIAAHGHADALAVTLSVEGMDLIGDPGTASYYGHPDWRKAHRGTRSHSTVTVDGQDQSVAGGPFMWTHHARARTNAADLQRGNVDAEHDGYRRLSDPVTHRRWLVAPPQEQAVVVVDVLQGRGVHEMSLHWPLHPALDAREVGTSGHIVSKDGIDVLQIAYGSLTRLGVAQVKGDSVTNLGWWSDRLEERVPSWLVEATCCGQAPLAMVTLLLPLGSGTSQLSDVELTMSGDSILTAWRQDGHRRVCLIDQSSQGAIQFSEVPASSDT